MATPAAILSILVQAQGLQKTASQIRGLDTDLDKAGKTGTRSGSAIKKMAGVVGGIVAFDTLRRGVGLAVSEFEEARKVGAQTNAVLKSTGGVANVTSKEINDLAGALSRKAGIDDEVIQSGANMLLTFRGIRNETGKGNDIFNQATAAALDMSVALGTDMKGSALQLGKALNDPAKGLTRLTRSGVTFTEQQTKQIKTLQASGDKLGAQKIILAELSKEFGGSAAAAATPLDKLKVAGLNLAEAAGSVLVPAIDKVARFLTTLINQMIEGKSVGGALVSVFRTTGDVAGGLVKAISDLVGWFKQHTTVTLALGSALGVVLAAFIGFKILAAVQAAIMAVQGAMLALNLALAANPIGLVVIAIAGLVAAFVVAYKESETFRKIVNAAWNAIKTTAVAVFGWLKIAVVDIANFLKARWDNIKTVVTTYWSLYRTLIINPIRSAFDWVRGAVRDVASWLAAKWDDIKSAASTAWGAFKSNIVSPVREAVDAVRGFIGKGKDGLITWLEDRVSDIKKAADALAKPFVGAFHTMRDAVKDVLEYMGKVIGAIKDVVGWIGKIKVPHISIPNPFSGGAGGGNVGPIGSAPASVDGFNDDAAAFGLSMTSGYRPGDPGWHGQNRARDYSNGWATSAELAFASYMAKNFGGKLLELIHTPLGFGIKNGAKVPLGFWGSAVNADHYDHVHVALEKGGIAPGGWALVGEKGPELAHLPGGTRVYPNGQSERMLDGSGLAPEIHVYIGDRELTDMVDVRIVERDRQSSRTYRAGVQR